MFSFVSFIRSSCFLLRAAASASSEAFFNDSCSLRDEELLLDDLLVLDDRPVLEDL